MFFNDKKKLRELRKQIRSKLDERGALMLVAAAESNKDRRSELMRELRDRTHTLEVLESDLIVEEAQRLGIDLPSGAERPSGGLMTLTGTTLEDRPHQNISLTGFLTLARQ